MGISAIENKRGIGSYNICNYNDKTKSILTILSLTDEKNFERNRKTIIKTAVGIPNTGDLKTDIEQILQGGFLSKAGWGGINKEKIDHSNKLAESFLKNELSAYEITGRIKELSPSLSSKEMTEIWTKLSIIEGLESLKDKALNKDRDWETEVEKNSLNPRLKNLTSSLNEDPEVEQKSLVKRMFRENYPHLKSSKGSQVNWGEIVSNLAPQTAGLLKSMLNSSKDEILKKTATQETLFPRPSQLETDNRRLANLLNTVGNTYTNRLKRYQRVLLNIEAHRLIDKLPKTSPPKATPQEIRNSEKLIKKLNNMFKELKIDNDPLDAPDSLSPLQIHPIKVALLRLKKINTPEAQETWKQLGGIISKCEENLSDTRLINLLIRSKDVPQQTLLKRVIEKCNSPVINENDIQTFLNKIEPSEENIAFLKSSEPAHKSLSVRNFLNRGMDQPKISEASHKGRGVTLLESLYKNQAMDPYSPLGESQVTPLQIAVFTRNKEETKALAEKLRGTKHLNTPFKDGKTPLFVTDPVMTKTLLKCGADFDIKDNDGKKADASNPFASSRKIIQAFKAKQKIKEDSAKSEALDIL